MKWLILNDFKQDRHQLLLKSRSALGSYQDHYC